MVWARDKPHNVCGNPLIKSSFIFKFQQRKEREYIYNRSQHFDLSRSEQRSFSITMRSVEDILLQLILQGDSFTYHRSASRPFAAPYHVAPSCCSWSHTLPIHHDVHDLHHTSHIPHDVHIHHPAHISHDAIHVHHTAHYHATL